MPTKRQRPREGTRRSTRWFFDLPLPRGVIGNTPDFGSVVPGSSPGGAT